MAVSFAQSPFLVEEGFASGSAPSGWTFTSISSNSTASQCGKAGKSLDFNATNDRIVSPVWSNGDQITFWMMADATPNSSDYMLVEGFNGSVWVVLLTARPHTTGVVIVINITSAITQVRITFNKGNTGHIYLDDFTVRKSGTCSGSIYIESISADACGSGCEGHDEFITFYTTTAMNVSDLEVSYPSAGTQPLTWCSVCTNSIVTNSTEVSALNSLAGCPVFLNPSSGIPANASVMLFGGNPQNTRGNFSSLCSGSTPLVQYYALFDNNTNTSSSDGCDGRFGNYDNSSGKDEYRDLFIRNRSTGCSDTNYYSRTKLYNDDGGAVYFSVQGSAPSYVHSDCSNFLVLPLTLIDFTAETEGNKTNLIWQTASESNMDFFSIEKSEDGISFTTIAKEKAFNKSELHTYSYFDETAERSFYYRLSATDKNGSSTHYNTVLVSPKKQALTVANFAGEVIITKPADNQQVFVSVFSADGTELFKDAFKEERYVIPSFIAANRFILVKVSCGSEGITKRFIFSAD